MNNGRSETLSRTSCSKGQTGKKTVDVSLSSISCDTAVPTDVSRDPAVLLDPVTSIPAAGESKQGTQAQVRYTLMGRFSVSADYLIHCTGKMGCGLWGLGM